MRKGFYLALIAFIGIVFSSCSMLDKDTTSYQLSDLQGLWLEDGTQHYVRFTTETAGEGYLYGREWDLAEDVKESDLLPYGNGWFKYRLDGKELLEIHKMDYGWGKIPKVNIVTTLTDVKLAYYEKEQPSVKFKFTKQ